MLMSIQNGQLSIHWLFLGLVGGLHHLEPDLLADQHIDVTILGEAILEVLLDLQYGSMTTSCFMRSNSVILATISPSSCCSSRFSSLIWALELLLVVDAFMRCLHLPFESMLLIISLTLILPKLEIGVILTFLRSLVT